MENSIAEIKHCADVLAVVQEALEDPEFMGTWVENTYVVRGLDGVVTTAFCNAKLDTLRKGYWTKAEGLVRIQGTDLKEPMSMSLCQDQVLAEINKKTKALLQLAMA